MSILEKSPLTARRTLLELLRRLHFYIGLLVGPFIFIAALTGTLYIVTPQLEQMLYRQVLFVTPEGPAHSLSEQIRVAREYLGENAVISAVRPAPQASDTTRVQFSEPGLGASESRAVFIDPYRLTVTGDLVVYGTSGILPFRSWLDHLHQSLHLGNVGRTYSELAASWMWVVALGGGILWMSQRTQKPVKRTSRFGFARYWHTTLGLVLLTGMLFLSVTGITWSQWGGENISALRDAFNWKTPQVNTRLDGQITRQPTDPHADHFMTPAGMDMPGMAMDPAPEPVMNRPDTDWDKVSEAARQAGITASRIEIRQPLKSATAWTVTEIDHRWPVKVDAVSISPDNFSLHDRVSFDQFPLAAKLTRWGVDAHIGVLFGWIKQLLLALFGLGLCVMIILGYRMWWLRRPAQPDYRSVKTLYADWRALPVSLQGLSLLLALGLGYALPVMGGSLFLFMLVDIWRWRQKMATEQRSAAASEALMLRVKQRTKFIRGVVIIWALTCVVMTRAIMGGVIDEYHISFGDWSFSMYLMQGMMILLYTSVFSVLMSIPLWYFFLGEEGVRE